MGKRRAESAFEDNPVINGFLEWMDAPEGQQSIEALDLVFGALEHAGVDARQRKIVWADGKRLSIEQSAERIHAGHPGVPRDLIELSQNHLAPTHHAQHPMHKRLPASISISARHQGLLRRDIMPIM